MGSDQRLSCKRVAALFAGCAISAGLVAAHLVVVAGGATYTGPLVVFDHIFSLALVLALFAIAAGVGGRVLSAGRVTLDGALEILLVWTAIGLGVLATAILGAGWLLGVHAWTLFGVLATGAVVGRRELRSIPVLALAAVASLEQAKGLGRCIFWLMVLFLITRALAPPTDGDTLVYHLRVPDQFLQAGAIFRPEDCAQFASVGLVHMLYLPLLALHSDAAPALISALCTIGLALATFTLAVRFLDERTAGLSLAAIWGSTILLQVGISPRTDTIVGFYLLLLQLLILRAHQTGDRKLLYVGAALAGMAIGIKFNALPYLLVLAPFGFWVVRTRLQARTGAALMITGIALATAAPWLIKNAVFLGDPLYPFLGGLKLDPWLARIYGGDALPPKLDPAAFSLVWRAAQPFNLVDLLMAPDRISVEGEGVLYYPNVLLLALPLALLFWRNRVLGWLGIPALAYVVLVVFMQPTTSLRYLIPAVAPLTLVAVYAYGKVLDWCLPARWPLRVLGVSVLLALSGTVVVVAVHAGSGRQFTSLLGLDSRETFLRTWTKDYADVVKFVNKKLPQQSRILMLAENRGYYFNVPVLQDNLIVNWPLLSAKLDSLDCLRPLGVTHVLVNVGAIEYLARRGLSLDGLDKFRSFANECLAAIYAHGAFTVYEVRAPAAVESS